MEQELSVLAKLYDGNEKLFDFHPRQDGTKKERLFYLLREHPNKPKAFYKGQLFDEGYKGTGYEVLRRGFLSELLQSFGPNIMAVPTTKGERWVVFRGFLKEVMGLKYLWALKPEILYSLRTVVELERKKAERLGLLEEEYWLTRFCLNSWGAFGNKRKTTFYQEKLIEVADCISIDSQMSKVKMDLDVIVVMAKNGNSKLIREVELGLQKLTDLNSGPRKEFFMPRVKFLKLRLADLKKNFQEVKNEGLALWAIRATLPMSISVSAIAGYIFYAYANLQNDKEVKKWKSVAFELVDAGSMNWFVFKEVFVGYSLFNFRIDEAASALKEVNEVRRLNKRLPSFKVKLWELYEGFILFLLNSGQVDLELKFTRDSAHSIRRDLIQGDKTGVNVSVLVLDFLNQLNEDQYESLIDLEDSLARYVSRNLKGEENQRPKIFIGMLLKVIQLDFNAFEVEKKTRRQLEKLKAMKPNLNMNMGGNEIIRYEVLWEWILKKLKESSLLPKPKS